MEGLFVTIEGVEGCGKSTQIRRLRDCLASQGHQVIATREPGGTTTGEAVRRILLDPANTALCSMAELLLYEAARAQLVEECIRPALADGKIVLCDRFADSTTAYQGAGRDLPLDMVQELHRIATAGVWPDLTIVLDLPPSDGLARTARRKRDRMEAEPLAFHEKVRAGFLRLAELEPDRVKVVDAARSIEAVTEDIRALVTSLMGNS